MGAKAIAIVNKASADQQNNVRHNDQQEGQTHMEEKVSIISTISPNMNTTRPRSNHTSVSSALSSSDDSNKPLVAKIAPQDHKKVNRKHVDEAEIKRNFVPFHPSNDNDLYIVPNSKLSMNRHLQENNPSKLIPNNPLQHPVQSREPIATANDQER